MKASLLLCIPLLWSGSLFAQTATTDIPPPPAISDEEELEPEVNIIKREDKTIEEYSVNGRVYMIKVTPDIGEPYFLVDSDGNGSLDARRSNQLQPEMMIPQWVLFRW